MMTPTELSDTALREELAALRQEVEELRQEKEDLEVMLEMTTDHSDTVEEELHSKAEEALRESERRLRLIVEATPVPVLISRVSDGRIVYANAIAGPLFDLSTEALLAQKITDFYADPEIQNSLRIALAEKGEINNFELQLKKVNGQKLWAEISLRPIFFNNERSLLGAIYDITERKQAAEALEEAIANLKQVDKLKDEFLANTSHELRTPLNGIIGIAESMIDGATGPLSPEQAHNLSMVISSGRRLSNLVNDILDFSKLRHKEIELQVKPIDLRPIVEIVLALSKPLTAEKSVVLENEIPLNLPPIMGDENRLQQILLNLVGNAIKFTPEGAVTVAAAVCDDRVEVRVSDTGIGIPAAKLESIFQSFEQVDASTERNYGGTGLGLSITRQLVELHGGRIRVESSLGDGAHFIFSMPISPEEALPRTSETLEVAGVRDYASTPEMISPIAATPISERPGDVTILVVDDEPVNRQVLLNHLSLHNYHVVQAGDGLAALESVKQHKPDLILLDVMMPRMSGYEACRRIRQQYSAVGLPVVMLTAKNQVGNLVEGFNAGANDYLTKPFSRDELVARIQTHLQAARMHLASSRFVPSEFLAFLQKESLVDVSLGDHVSKEMSVMFSDLRSFTSISETMTPQENFDFVNAYLKRVSPVVRDHRGFIIKYLGDGIMAVFPEQADDGVQASIEKLNQVADYNSHRQTRGRQPIQVGIGLHTGHMMVGMVGETYRMQGDAFSDHVNLTARLEGLTKFYGVSLIITAETYRRLADPERYHIRFLDKVRVKGREDAVHLYEVFDADPPDLRARKEATLEDFSAALNLYYDRQFADAQARLFRVLQHNPADKVAWHHLVNATRLLEEGISENWTGVTVMTQK